MKIKKLLPVILTCLLTACVPPPETPEITPTPEPTPVITDKATEILNNMTLEEKIGQLFIIRPESLDNSLSPEQVNDTYSYGITSINDNLKENIKIYQPGGIVMFGKNIDTPEQIKTFTEDLQNNSNTKLFMCIDEEGGSVSRIAKNKNFNVPTFPSALEIGNSDDIGKSEKMGYTIGSYIKDYGFNFDFAPVADVCTDSEIIGNRSFGSNPFFVSDMVRYCIIGFHNAGIISTVKHFPGHGNVKGDTHLESLYITKTWDELMENDLIPFYENTSITDAVMVSHITCDNVTHDNLPASLSKVMLTDKLRNEFEFNGLIITDSLAMKAISDNYSSSEAAVKAINAGADIVLMPLDYIEAFNGVLSAVNSGEIPVERINESVKRIIDLKIKYNII